MRNSWRGLTAGDPILPLLLLFAISAVDGMDGATFGVLLPEVQDWFGVSLTTALTLQSIAGIFVIFLAVPLGHLSDRVNRIVLTVAAGVLWGAMAFLTGFAPTVLILFLARFGSGITAAAVPAHNSLIADYYKPEARTAVFTFFTAAGPAGGFFGPIIGGYLAAKFTWQTPFIVFAIPSLALAAIIAVKLREPVRGGQDRAALGLDTDAADDGPPPSMTESWRISYSVRTLRRIWWALPFLAGGYSSFVNYLGIYFDRVHHLGTVARGDLVAAVQPFTLAGLAAAAVLGTRLVNTRPSRLITYVGLVGVGQAVSLALVAVAPTWWLAVIPLYGGTFVGAILEPALFTLLTLVIPARVRGSALGWAVLFAGPGLLIGPVMGAVNDALGPRWGIAGAIPFFLVGSLIIASAGASVDADIRNARAAAAAATAAAALGGEAARNLLVVRDLDVHYGSVQILFGVDLDVAEGEILALLGTNGAGKSTLLRAIAGTVMPSAGAVFFDGDDITHLPPAVHAKRGIAQVQGGNGIFPGLTVAENLDLAQWGVNADDTAVAEALALFPVLQQRADQQAGSLSGGEQQMLALAQAFLAKPKLLVIDELSLGLSPAVVEQLLEVVRAIHAAGTTVVLVEQSINVAFSIAQRAVFMEKGEVRFDGATGDLLDRPDILRAVFLAGGATASAGSYGHRRREEAHEPGVALEVRGLTKAFGGIRATNGVTFQLQEGAILGLIGPNGAGKTTLFDLIGGFIAPDEGEVLLGGEDITALPTHVRAKAGLHRSFQDARLFPALTVTEAISISLERHLQNKSALMAGLHLPMVRKAERKVALRAERILELLGLGVHRDKFLRELSTGTRRLVDLACVVATEPKVLLLDEPSAGVAQKETEELGPILERIRYEVGCAILLIEHDMPLISAVSDELLALEQGAVVTRGAPTDVLNHPQVIAAYLGNDESTILRSGAPVRA